MIIKSLSRKDASFEQLSGYILKEADKNYIYARNFYCNNLEDKKEISKEFRENYLFLKKQKNSNALYHEIISLTKSNKIDLESQKEILFKIADDYINARAKENLVFGSLHELENNIHFHLMISSNPIESERNHYLSKKEFDEVKKGFENYVLKKYPELEQGKIINKEKNKNPISQKEYQLRRRLAKQGKKTQKDIVVEKLLNIFSKSNNKEEFFNKLYENKLEIYTRGKNIGFKNLETNNKHRLKTLALEKQFELMNEKFNSNLNNKNKESEQEKQHKAEEQRQREAEQQRQREAEQQRQREAEQQRQREAQKEAKKTKKNKPNKDTRVNNKKANKPQTEKEKEILERKKFVRRVRNKIKEKRKEKTKDISKTR